MNCVGVIVTYNRKDLLLQNLRMLKKQSVMLDKVIIIDNHSTDGTFGSVKREFPDYKSWIDYKYMKENTGGAGGFYYGVRYAYKSGANNIWLMDDDGRAFDKDTFKNIMNARDKLYKKNQLLFLNSLVTTDGRHLSFELGNLNIGHEIREIQDGINGSILYGKANPFNGTLISRELVEKIGFPQKEFFLSRDETDYLKRSQEVGALIATITNSIYYHPVSKLKRRKLFHWYTPIFDTLDKEYYVIRNLTYTYTKNVRAQKIRIIGFVILRILTIILYEDKKWKRICQIPIAILDALHGRMGKRIHNGGEK